MKHYVVVLDWATDEGESVQILGVAHTIEEAKEIFNQHLAEQKEFAEENGYDIDIDTETRFDSGVMGYWRIEHTTLYIQEVK